MGAELEVTRHKFRHEVPAAHRTSIDTRIVWLWNQRFGTVQQVWLSSKDLLDKTAATLLLQAVFGQDLESISQVFQRIEGSARFDSSIDDDPDEEPIRV